MKKRIIISLLCGLVICCMAAYSFGTTGIVNTDTLRLRRSNSTDSSIIALLSIDDKVEILERTENGWYKVKYTDAKTQTEYEGYVSGEYITVKEENESIPETNQSEENKTSEEENNENPQEEVGTKEETVVNTNKIINKGEKVYIIPLINSNTTKILENDMNVKVETELNGWSYVTSDDFEGWVRTDKLKDVDSKNKVGYINASSVNFREEPDSSGEIISTLSRNNQVEIIEENNGWTKVKYNGNVGYVASRYISDTKTETTSRSAASRRTTTNTTSTDTTTKVTDATDTEVVSNATASEVVAYAKNYLGYKYVMGGNSPSGFDCSGFTQYVYKHFGYSLSRTGSSQASNGVAVSKSNLQQGDLLCFSGSSGSTKISHVGIYVGGGKFIHAANSRSGVIISRVDGDGYFYVCARRIIN